MKNKYEILDNGNVIASNMSYEIVNILMLALLENEEINYPSVTIRKMVQSKEETVKKGIKKVEPVEKPIKEEPLFMNEPSIIENPEELFI